MSNLTAKPITPGTGDFVKPGQTIIVHYTGKLNDENGLIFDSSEERNSPFEFTVGVGQVIQGWEVGILGDGDKIKPMQVGEVRFLTIPPNMGYGASGAGNVIPPNATLFFKVSLLGIK
jgi:peptidylprolyl isomerase